MNASDARELLGSGSSHQRLLAARRLAHEADPEDRPLLSERLVFEEDVYVRRVLSLALEVIDQDAEAPANEGDEMLDEESDDLSPISRAGFQDALDMFVHEIKPLLALLKRRAARELTNPEVSDTIKEIAKIDDLVSALGQLSDAASSLKDESFDLTVALTNLITAEFGDSVVEVVPATTASMQATGSKALVEMVSRNAIRNAIEAVEPLMLKEDVVVAWGETDRDYWLVVIDRGIGLPERRSKMLDFGVTGKKGHRGAGLAVAKQAALTLGGDISVDSRQEGGTRFELRWPKAGVLA